MGRFTFNSNFNDTRIAQTAFMPYLFMSMYLYFLIIFIY